MTTNQKTNFISGLFVVIVIAALVGNVIFLQGYKPPLEGLQLSFVFDDAPGIRESADVVVGGTNVGTVESVRIEQNPATIDGVSEFKTQVVVTIRVTPEAQKSIKIYANASADVVTSVFRASLIRLYPGGPTKDDPSVAPVKDKAKLQGRSPASFDDLMRQGQNVLKNVESITTKVDDILGDDELRDKIRANLESAATLLADVSDSLRSLKPSIENVGPILDSGRSVMEQIDAMLAENRVSITNSVQNAEALSGEALKLLKRLDELGNSVDGIVEDVSTLLGSTNNLIDDNQVAIAETLSNAREASAFLRDTTEKLRRDPSIVLWGTDEDDNAADRQPGNMHGSYADELRLRDSGRLPPRERD